MWERQKQAREASLHELKADVEKRTCQAQDRLSELQVFGYKR